MSRTTHKQTLSQLKVLCTRMDQIRNEIIKLKDCEEARDDFFISDTCDALFTAVLNIANYCCGDVEWAETRQFLKEAGVKVPDEFDRQMAEMDR